MGFLIDGVWQDSEAGFAGSSGKFERSASAFRNWVTPDGAAGPSGTGGFPGIAGRYHLYVSHACPWAHRTLIFRKLKKLDAAIPVTNVDPFMGSKGWSFSDSHPDTLNGASYLHQLYMKAKPDYSGRATVPVLWDKEQQTIVSNESSEIIRMMNSAFPQLTEGTPDFYPEHLREEIDAINERVYHTVNNGVYKSGFAGTQEHYDSAVKALFETLDDLETRLDNQAFLAGGVITEADWRLFTTLIRFDAVYVGHFKCNIRRIADYPVLSAYLRQLYQHPGIAETVDLVEIKAHYYRSHESVNPTRIVPAGPVLDLASPHDRGEIRFA